MGHEQVEPNRLSRFLMFLQMSDDFPNLLFFLHFSWVSANNAFTILPVFIECRDLRERMVPVEATDLTPRGKRCFGLKVFFTSASCWVESFQSDYFPKLQRVCGNFGIFWLNPRCHNHSIIALITLWDFRPETPSKSSVLWMSNICFPALRMPRTMKQFLTEIF